jgi:hypothetical protein
MDISLVAKLQKIFEDGFAGSIWGNSPPRRSSSNTATLERPTSVSISLTGDEVQTILQALESQPDSGNIVAKLKQSRQK